MGVIKDLVALPNARLVAELHESNGLAYLRVHSPTRAAQDLLLPLRHEHLCGGVAQFTPLGRLHALFWALAYGRSCHQDGLRVRFASGQVPYQPSVETKPLGLADTWWVADAEGIFGSVVVLRNRSPVAQADLLAPTCG